MEFISWLKRIFSVGTISVIIGLASLTIAYLSFFRGSPGKLTLAMSANKLDKEVSTVFILTPVEQDGKLDFLKQSIMPYLANYTQRTVQDCSMMIEFYTDKDYEVYSDFMSWVDSTQYTPKVEIAKKIGDMGYMDAEGFPLRRLSVGGDEPKVTTFGWTYIHRGMKTTRTYYVHLITVPKSFIKRGSEDLEFLKILRPYLLDEKNPKAVAISYNGAVIANPRNVDLLRSKSIESIRIRDLQ